ncbi:MAG: DUF3592 domain-containing protein [Lentisphaerae bacterium]|jgi:hypothetical protein|nr:DUF3592 domain-containing protein [Lentisphaerota bacterium]
MAENTGKQPSWGKNSIGTPLFFCVFFTILGGFLWLIFGLIPLYQVIRSSSWVPCSAVVTFSGISRDGRRIIVEYDYVWKDQKFQGDRYDFYLSRFRHRGPGEPNREKILESYSPGREIECLVNPDKPSEAVISRKIPWWAWAGMVIPAIFVAVGINSGRTALRNIQKKYT